MDPLCLAIVLTLVLPYVGVDAWLLVNLTAYSFMLVRRCAIWSHSMLVEQDGPPLRSGIKMQEKSQFIHVKDNRYKADTMSMLFQIRLKNH
jgi:hypothetical protein